MPRKSRSRKKAPRAVQSEIQPSKAPQDPGRRATIERLGLYTLGLAAIGGGGTAFAYDFMRAMGEQDLSKIGQGVPTIVQIHDPQCSMCRALQAETRTALRGFEAGSVTYLVANIRSQDGAAFANGLGLGHVTLVLFDGAGGHVHTIEGVTPADSLRSQISQHLELTPRS